MVTSAYNATLIERRDLNADLAIVRVQPDDGRLPAFEPGQYTLIGLYSDERRSTGEPRLLRRAYSLASSPAQTDALEFYLVRVRDGQLTPGLWSVPVGGRVWLDPKPHGHFTLHDVPREVDLVLVATGTGLAPYISMLRTYADQDRWRRLVIMHGVRTQSDLGYREEIEAARQRDPSLTYLPILSREPEDSGWTGLRGRVQDILVPGRFRVLTGEPLDPARSYVFLCGHPEMIRTTSEQLAARGFVPKSKDDVGSMHFEKYW